MESNTAHEANVYQMSLCASSCDTRERNRDTSLPPCRAQGPAGVGNYKPTNRELSLLCLGWACVPWGPWELRGGVPRLICQEEECKGESRREWA